MQRQSSTNGPLPETNDANMGSIYHSSDIDQHHSIDNRTYREGTRLSSYMGSSSASINADAHGVDGLIGWSPSHPNSTLNPEDQVNADGIKDQNGGAYSNFGGSHIEPPNVLPTMIHSSNQVTTGPVGFQNAINFTNTRSADANGINSTESGNSGPSLELLGTSSVNSGHMDNMSSGSSSSSGTWGLSCKRRAFEGTSRQSQPSSSISGSNPQAENSPFGDRGPSISPGGMSLSPPSTWHSSGSSYLEQLNPRSEIGRRDIGFEPFPSSRVPGNGENAHRNFSRHVEREYTPQQEPVPFNLSSGRTYRRPHSFALHQPYRPGPSSEGINLRSALRVGSVSSLPAVPSVLHGTEISGNVSASPWSGASQSRIGNPSNSSLSRDVPSAEQEDVHVRNNGRSISEVPMFTSPNEAGSTPMHLGQSSNIQSSPSAWGSNQTRSPIQQQLLEIAPWSFFPTANSVAGRQSSNLPSPSLGPSSSLDTANSNGGNTQIHHTHSRRSGLSMDIQDDDDDIPEYLRYLPSAEARTRLISEIRHVLDALHRGERLPIEEFLVFEPFVHHGLAEIHDRHRDMRLDVDNMSYEELLALEERIGDVSTGLPEETILKYMKQKKKLGSDISESVKDLEPCCICQEEYTDGDDLGILDCGHEFHAECIKQWLVQKNLCPICKTTALVT